MRIGIMGTGNMGVSFLLSLRDPANEIRIVASSPEKTRKQARLWQVQAATPRTIARQCDLLLLTVPDDVLPTLRPPTDAAHPCCVFHCSGALPVHILEPWQNRGYCIGALHPLQSIHTPRNHAFRGTYFAVDGEPAARKAGNRLVQQLGGHSFYVPEAERAAYHAAACFASNYVVTMAATAQELFRSWLRPEEAAQALFPLLKGTVENIKTAPLWRTALTGPIARGDRTTLTRHLAVLPESLRPLYCEAGMRTAALALRNGTICKEQYEQIGSILAMAKGDYHEKNNQPDHSQNEKRRHSHFHDHRL